jgi:hypothetical protein
MHRSIVKDADLAENRGGGVGGASGGGNMNNGEGRLSITNNIGKSEGKKNIQPEFLPTVNISYTISAT